MQRYIYKGPVEVFGKCVEHNWSGETVAPSLSKARSNLVYQYKRQANRGPNTPIKLPGKLKEAGLYECL